MTIHQPVLLKEVLKYLSPKPNQNFIDCTIGGGGHTFSILEKNAPHGKILGIDWNRKAIEELKLRIQNLKIKKRLILVNDNFTNLKKIVEKYKFKDVSGILIDLGLSSDLLERSKRGFSFKRNEVLDMRFGEGDLTAFEIVNKWSEKEIEKILKEFGEERFSKRIAKEIVKVRKNKPIKTTFDLVEIIKKVTPIWYQKKKIHPATKTFQALRIAVNNELENLKNVLPQALEVLKPEGKIVVISYHSLEDRIVKNFFREKKDVLKILTKKPVRPSLKEIENNPRARSAKLRAVEKK